MFELLSTVSKNQCKQLEEIQSTYWYVYAYHWSLRSTTWVSGDKANALLRVVGHTAVERHSSATNSANCPVTYPKCAVKFFTIPYLHSPVMYLSYTAINLKSLGIADFKEFI